MFGLPLLAWIVIVLGVIGCLLLMFLVRLGREATSTIDTIIQRHDRYPSPTGEMQP